jgi:hypothetical protein
MMLKQILLEYKLRLEHNIVRIKMIGQVAPAADLDSDFSNSWHTSHKVAITDVSSSQEPAFWSHSSQLLDLHYSHTCDNWNGTPMLGDESKKSETFSEIGRGESKDIW